MTPAERHAAVLAQIDGLTAELRVAERFMPPETIASAHALLAGRRRILERHAPRTDHGRPNAVTWCDHRLCYEDRETWPCDDYRDAAADLLPPDTEG